MRIISFLFLFIIVLANAAKSNISMIAAAKSLVQHAHVGNEHEADGFFDRVAEHSHDHTDGHSEEGEEPHEHSHSHVTIDVTSQLADWFETVEYPISEQTLFRLPIKTLYRFCFLSRLLRPPIIHS